MRLAVLISSYIILAYGALTVMSTYNSNSENSGTVFLGMIIFSVPLVISIIYAHSQRDK